MSSLINGRTPRERVLSRLTIDPGGCLLWTGEISPTGYGYARAGGHHPLVHRLMYEWFVGPIPSGLQIDHLCRVRHCAAPAHLEAVTPRENTRRSLANAWRRAITHCPQNHPYDAANTLIAKAGDRRCKACSRDRSRVWRAQRAVAR